MPWVIRTIVFLAASIAFLLVSDAKAQNQASIQAVPSVDHGRIRSAIFSPDGTMVLSASNDRTARLWSAGTGRLIRQFAHNSLVSSLAFSRDGTQIATGSSSGNTEGIKLWDTASGQLIRAFKG